MKFIQTYNVIPTLPEELLSLRELAYNYWWGWNADAFNIFRHIAADLWTQCGHNPIRFLSMVSQERLKELTGDEGFIYHLDRVRASFNGYMQRKTWFQNRVKNGQPFQVAYFSAEFGINEGLPIYSGGLGVLAGDHLKSASDLGVPLVAVGLAYHQGYFRQYLTQDGWQQEKYVENDFYNMPLMLMRDEEKKPILIEIDFPGRKVKAQIWKIQVGRVPLYLLSTNVAENSPQDRNCTAQLYGGDAEMRLQQEIILGVGGVRALDKLGLLPAVTHMNEGHSAFLGLERIRYHMEHDHLSFSEAQELVLGSNIFTTHTPVPAGIDVFPPDMIEKYLAPLTSKFGISSQEFLGLGRVNPADAREYFSMAILALKLSARTNGVARLHGRVSRRMWQNLWPQLPEDEIPITHITNGVHVNSWISAEMSELFDRYLGPRWLEEPGDQKIWERIAGIPSAELWRTHERRRERLVGYVRRKLRQQLVNRGASGEEIEMAAQVLDPEALTIGFARRVATYKRATLIFKDIERLIQLITDKNRPIQIIFAGKAHPHDEPGKRLIQEVIKIARRGEMRRYIVFLEDYDLNCAHYLVQGVDVWLNNPRRPLEASGTSGMKAVFNGCLNCSILDGWWDEGFNGNNGWAIGRGEEYENKEYQDQVESASFYQILENEIIPLFYDRGPDNIPENWIKMMKRSMTSLGPIFNTNRMVTEYTEKFYIPLMQRLNKMKDNDCTDVRKFAVWKAKVLSAWGGLKIDKVQTLTEKEYPVGAELQVRAAVKMGDLTPEDIQVEVFYGHIDERQMMYNTNSIPMEPEKDSKGSKVSFVGSVPCTQTGNHGFTIRVLPKHPDLAHRFELNLVAWAG
ncbi:alpha-glucan family phosphorylase [candidate division FCPU426 bacterium]|nr:alpha-glucan family phosphorylase [candidate division FCPU426 bacterium]